MAVIVKGVTSSGGGAKLATILNDDGTQSLIITDKDSVIDLTPMDSEINEQTDLIAQIQAELDAKAEGGGSVVSSAPVLLWTNASPASNFAAQTVTLPAGYDGYIVELRYSANTVGVLNRTFVPNNGGALCAVSAYAQEVTQAAVVRLAIGKASAIEFSQGKSASSSTSYGDEAIPTRIWGVKFTL